MRINEMHTNVKIAMRAASTGVKFEDIEQMVIEKYGEDADISEEEVLDMLYDPYAEYGTRIPCVAPFYGVGIFEPEEIKSIVKEAVKTAPAINSMDDYVKMAEMVTASFNSLPKRLLEVNDSDISNDVIRSFAKAHNEPIAVRLLTLAVKNDKTLTVDPYKPTIDFKLELALSAAFPKCAAHTRSAIALAVSMITNPSSQEEFVAEMTKILRGEI